ncbi:hypothetical protein [Lysobacter gummosus]
MRHPDRTIRVPTGRRPPSRRGRSRRSSSVAQFDVFVFVRT